LPKKIFKDTSFEIGNLFQQIFVTDCFLFIYNKRLVDMTRSES